MDQQSYLLRKRATPANATTSTSTLQERTERPSAPKRKGVRPNKLLGRIVPLILLTYVYFTYKLVIVRYCIRYLYETQRMRFVASSWILVLHLLFLIALRAYFHVFFAHTARTEGSRSASVTEWLRHQLGAVYPESPHSVSSLLTDSALFAGTAELCNADGSPVVCFRDQCNGKVKTFRTRHCGDCGVCRIGFDHHCAWFDNDVTAPATLRSFILFLACVPPLIGLAVGPLVPSAWRTACRIKSYAVADTEVKRMWSDQWYSWVGGPVFRWMVGWCIGARNWSAACPRTGRLPHEIISAPLATGFGLVLIVIASSLAYSTLLNLSRGLLTIDVERSKAFEHLSRRRTQLMLDAGKANKTIDKGRLKDIDARLQALAPTLSFRVRQGETDATNIVSMSVEDGLLSRGEAWDNLRYFLWDRHAPKQMKEGWALSDSALRHLTQAQAVTDTRNIPI